jgi:hypothetical protein
MTKRRVGVEYSPSMLEPVRPGAMSPDRALCLPTFISFVIVNKTSLSLSLSLSFSFSTASLPSSLVLSTPLLLLLLLLPLSYLHASLFR